MIETDVLVVGAGPAGSIAAKHAALGGAEVILIDKKSEIGTPKRCAEGVYERGLEWLGIEPDPFWAVKRINGGVIIAPDGTDIVIDDTIISEKGYILERKLFDKSMAMDAARAGAQIKIKTLAKSFRREEINGVSYAIVTCETMGNVFDIKAKIVIAADGPESHIANWAGINSTTKLSNMGSAFQYEMVGVNCNRMDLLELHMGNFASGCYVWIFPKGDDIANVGMAINNHDGKKTIKEYLDDFISSYPPLKNATPIEINVGGVPIGGLIEKIYADNLLICGDAAGQVNPMTGGGIILSMLGGMSAGTVAAKAIKDQDYSENRLEEYEELFNEKSFGAIPKLSTVREVYNTLSDDDLNSIIDKFAQLDLTDLTLRDVLKVFLKISPRLTIKFRKLVKLIL